MCAVTFCIYECGPQMMPCSLGSACSSKRLLAEAEDEAGSPRRSFRCSIGEALVSAACSFESTYRSWLIDPSSDGEPSSARSSRSGVARKIDTVRFVMEWIQEK